MAERPLIILPHPENVERPKSSGFSPRPPKPQMNDRRKKTFDDKFQDALNYIQSTPAHVDPEMVLVIETIGKIQDLHNAVEKIKGLEWLGEEDLDDIEIEEDAYDNEEKRKDAKRSGGRLYLISSNQNGLSRIHSMWKNYKADKSLPYGSTKWRDVFTYIKDIRYWNKNDRVEETGILDYWRDEIKVKEGSESSVSFELELHFYKEDLKAAQVEQELSRLVKELNGTVVKTVRISDIGFHAMKISSPVNKVKEMRENFELDSEENISVHNNLVRSNYIKYFRPIPQQLVSEEIPTCPAEIQTSEITKKQPIIALFDGYPMTNHSFLKGRLGIDDPDDFNAAYTAGEQKHGTSMASLVSHGDLQNHKRRAVTREIYVRPIMKPNEHTRVEQIPIDEFPEDLMERAVTRIFGITGKDKDAVAPSIKIINLSIGNLDRPFHREMSPWARSLDWLSWKYKVLFIVSAGNFLKDEIQISSNEKSLSETIIKEMDRSLINRRILSPAESMNCLTVGAVHFDHSNIPKDDTRVDVFEKEKFIAEYSRLGCGYYRSIKPDIVVQGGRQFFKKDEKDENILLLKRINNRMEPPGQQAAFVGSMPENIKNTSYSQGTSNATALTTNAAGIIYEVIDELRSEFAGGIPEEYDALLIKSLLVHGASWDKMDKKLQIIKNKNRDRKFRIKISQYLGYGEPNFDRVTECTERRVTCIGFGKLNNGKRHRFVLPITDACKDTRYRLIVTLAYFTPINSFSAKYRAAKVFFESPLSRANRKESDYQQVQKGTLQHEILELRDIQDDVELFVQCRSDLLDEAIPYALSLTLEAIEEIDIDIYYEIKQQIRIRSH